MVCTRILTCDLIYAGRLLVTDRRPRTELAGNHRYAVELQRGPRASEEEIGTDPNQARRAVRLDDRRWHTDHAVAVQILMEARLQRLQRGAAARRSSDDVGREVAVVVGGPHNILICTRVLQLNLLSLHGALPIYRRPRTELAGN